MARYKRNRSDLSWIPILLEVLGDCALCGMPSETIDHIFPLGEGGHHCLSNLQALCEACHLAKTKIDLRRMRNGRHLSNTLKCLKSTPKALAGYLPAVNGIPRPGHPISHKNAANRL